MQLQHGGGTMQPPAPETDRLTHHPPTLDDLQLFSPWLLHSQGYAILRTGIDQPDLVVAINEVDQPA